MAGLRRNDGTCWLRWRRRNRVARHHVDCATAFTVIACSGEGETSSNTDVTTVADVIDAVTGDATTPDAGGDCDGVWEDCCADDGTIEKCCITRGRVQLRSLQRMR